MNPFSPWQSMDTAPRDGTPVDIWIDCYNGPYYTGSFRECEMVWDPDWKWWIPNPARKGPAMGHRGVREKGNMKAVLWILSPTPPGY